MGVSYIELDKLPSPEVLASVEDRCNQVMRMFMMMMMIVMIMMFVMIMMTLILTMMVIAMILGIESDGWNQPSITTLESGEKSKELINLFQKW